MATERETSRERRAKKEGSGEVGIRGSGIGGGSVILSRREARFALLGNETRYTTASGELLLSQGYFGMLCFLLTFCKGLWGQYIVEDGSGRTRHPQQHSNTRQQPAHGAKSKS